MIFSNEIWREQRIFTKIIVFYMDFRIQTECRRMLPGELKWQRNEQVLMTRETTVKRTG